MLFDRIARRLESVRLTKLRILIVILSSAALTLTLIGAAWIVWINSESDDMLADYKSQVAMAGAYLRPEDVPQPRDRPANADEIDPTGDLAARYLLTLHERFPALMDANDSAQPIYDTLRKVSPALRIQHELDSAQLEALVDVVEAFDDESDFAVTLAQLPPSEVAGILKSLGHPEKPVLEWHYPNLFASRNMASVSMLHAVLEAAEGEQNRAIARLSQGVRSHLHYTDQPNSIARATGIAVGLIYLDAVPFVLRSGAVSDRTLDDLAKTLRSCMPRRSLDLDRSEDFWAMEDSFRSLESTATDFSSRAYFSHIFRWERQYDMARFIYMWLPFLEILRSDSPQTIEDNRRLRREFEALIAESPRNLGIVMADVIIPDYGDAIVVDFEYRTYLRVAATSIAALRYQQRIGDLPAKLEELVPEFLQDVPIDPFDGTTLRYEQRGSGFIIYGIGRNGVDDGGVDDRANGDIVWDLSNRKSLEELRQTQ